MSINHEVKGNLARLLATENLIVEHKKISTAMFDVERRVLTLPIWDRASDDVYDMLVAHEVGHALYTPTEDWTERVDIPKQYVNVTEDARIEKLMKRRYAGLNKTFFKGYSELCEQDFFDLENEDLGAMNLADRVNLWFKIGAITSIPIKREEMNIINMIADAETFDDALNAAKVLYEYCKQQLNKVENNVDIDIQSQQENQSSGSENTSSSDVGEEEAEGETESGSEDEQVDADDLQQNSNAGGKQSLDVKTDDALNEKLESLSSLSARETIYLERPEILIQNVVASNKDCHENLNKFYAEHNDSMYEISDLAFLKYKNASLKEINYLVKEFECKKAADSYARASVSRTGVLDTQNLHTYKWNEDLFKKVTTFADGKNHGLVFILDWSGSMADVMLDTIKQLFNLVSFCRKVGIPYDVYAFTSEYKTYFGERNSEGRIVDNIVMKPNTLYIDPSFGLMNILSSQTKNKESDIQMRNIFRVVYSFKYYNSSATPFGWGLSGTPLNESLLSLHKILPEFQRKNKLQKMHCIVLTDGEAQNLTRTVLVKRPWEDSEKIGVNHVHGNCQLRDRKTGTVYSEFEGPYHSATKTILQNLSDNFPSTNFIGIRLLGGRDFRNFVRMYMGSDFYSFEQSPEYSAIEKSWKKERSVAVSGGGYKKYFAINSNSLDEEFNFSEVEAETKSQIRNAFKKSLKTKMTSKKILNEFISLVA